MVIGLLKRLSVEDARGDSRATTRPQKRLLDNATNALLYINTKAADNGRKRQRKDDNSNINPPAAKRPATNISVQGHSPAVQVSLYIHVQCN